MLTDLVELDTLRKLQKRFSALGRVTVCLCDVAGKPILPPTWGSRYSELIGTSSAGRRAFARSVREAASDPAARVPSLCHEGMSLYAAPVAHRGRRLAVIVIGTRTARRPTRAVVRTIAERYCVDSAALWEAAASIDPYRGGEPEAICRFADVLADIIATIYGQARKIERQLGDLQAVHELSRLLAGTKDLQEILDVTVRRVVDVMPIKASVIRLLDEDTGELVIQAVHNLSPAYLNKGPVFLKDNALDVLAFRGETVYVADAPSDPRVRYPESARREGIVSALSVPMTHRGQTVGVLRVYTSRTYRFRDAETSLLRSIGSQAAAAIMNHRLYEEQARHQHVQRQMRGAAEVQRRMLPARTPRHPALSVGSVYVPTLELGGDFYDFIEHPDGSLGVCIADVVGKGLPAALLMASVRAALRTAATEAGGVRDTVLAVNRHMCRDTLPSEFATLVFGVIAPDGRRVRYVNAGHLPPIRLRGDSLEELGVGGTVVGVDLAAEFDEGAVTLNACDVLVMTTDGVTEAIDFHGRTYGRKRLIESIRRHRALTAEQLARQILWDVRRFAGLAEQSDDITIVVIKAK